MKRAGKFGVGSRSILVASTAAAAVCAAWTPAARAADAEAFQVGEVVVTGEKIDRSLKETTTAVTVLRHVDPNEFRSPYDLASRVPNMLGTAADLPSIRGVTGSGPGGGIFTLMSGARPRVATLIDGLPETFGGQRYADVGLWDVDQVEVLRGPQSTTQGRNSLGGAIVVTTKDPTFKWEGAARAGYETEGGKSYLAGVVSGPIVADELAVRLAADGTRGESYIHYTGDGWPFDPSKIEQSNVRGKLLWTPKALPGFSALVTATQHWQEGEYLYLATGPNFFDYKFDNVDMNTRYSDSRAGNVSVKLEYQLSEAATAHLLYGHGWYKARFQQANSTGGGLGNLSLDEDNDTVEARLTYAPADRRLSGVLGLYYYDRHQDLVSDMGVNGPDSVKTYAAYADGWFELTDRLSLLFGGRVEQEKQTRDVALSWGAVTTDRKESLFLPKVGLQYVATPSTNVGFVVRKGYSPGGGAIDWDNGTYYQYDKEEVVSYELSTRTELADRRVTLSTNLFYNDYDNYQGLLNFTFTNIPKARSYGLEVEATIRPREGLDVFGGLGLLDTKITEAPASFPTADGARLNNAPKVTVSLGFEQTFASGFFLGASANHVSRYSSQVESGVAIDGGDFTVVNAHLGYQTEHWAIRGYVKNLGDADILYSGRTNWAGAQAQVGQPRAFGVVLDANF
ncbi:TonB-dependent receptor [Phenylobacterium sp. LjRoot225]|uniref:TonB-dependent receptor n=1 Tax=Phenylobacterium sp. LjRoot225 TaxID=3342285 RepID=UPI003ECC8C06